jgi:hypothetical protein
MATASARHMPHVAHYKVRSPVARFAHRRKAMGPSLPRGNGRARRRKESAPSHAGALSFHGRRQSYCPRVGCGRPSQGAAAGLPRGCRGAAAGLPRAGVGWRWCAAAAQGPGRARAFGLGAGPTRAAAAAACTSPSGTASRRGSTSRRSPEANGRSFQAAVCSNGGPLSATAQRYSSALVCLYVSNAHTHPHTYAHILTHAHTHARTHMLRLAHRKHGGDVDDGRRDGDVRPEQPAPAGSALG